MPGREQAGRMILAGRVHVDGRRVDKAGALVSPAATVEVADGPRYVSRGGEKLAHALARFEVAVASRVCVDVGASTGGFTDCLLQRGAARVYAVDVGERQLHAKLREDPRVVVMDRRNARGLDPDLWPEPPSLAVVDVSFISLEKVLPAVLDVLAPEGEVVALVKPQFEVGRAAVGKGGVVRDRVQQEAAVTRLARWAVLRGWHVLGVTASPLRGPKGNREFFLHLSRGGHTPADLEAMIVDTVRAP